MYDLETEGKDHLVGEQQIHNISCANSRSSCLSGEEFRGRADSSSTENNADMMSYLC